MIPRARLLVADVPQRLLAAKRCVVWLTNCQKVRRQVSCHHLPCIDEDINGEEAKGVDSWEDIRRGGEVTIATISLF